MKQKDYAVVVVVADNSPSCKEFRNSSQRFVCRLIETVSQQVHGGEALVSLCKLSSGSECFMILCVLSRRGSDSLRILCALSRRGSDSLMMLCVWLSARH